MNIEIVPARRQASLARRNLMIARPAIYLGRSLNRAYSIIDGQKLTLL
jgi:hypothetical protein